MFANSVLSTDTDTGLVLAVSSQILIKIARKWASSISFMLCSGNQVTRRKMTKLNGVLWKIISSHRLKASMLKKASVEII
jgi:hypothetical protein